MKTILQAVAWIAGFIGAILGILYFGFYDVYTLPSDDPVQGLSVGPNLSMADTVALSRHADPNYRDLVRCPDPQARGRFVIGRVMGKAGDHVTLDAGIVSTDSDKGMIARGCARGRQAIQPASGDLHDFQCRVERVKGADRDTETLFDPLQVDGLWETTVEPGKLVLISDNRSAHVDSRDFGQIDAGTCAVIPFRVWTSDPAQSRFASLR